MHARERGAAVTGMSLTGTMLVRRASLSRRAGPVTALQGRAGRGSLPRLLRHRRRGPSPKALPVSPLARSRERSQRTRRIWQEPYGRNSKAIFNGGNLRGRVGRWWPAVTVGGRGAVGGRAGGDGGHGGLDAARHARGASAPRVPASQGGGTSDTGGTSGGGHASALRAAHSEAACICKLPPPYPCVR